MSYTNILVDDSLSHLVDSEVKEDEPFTLSVEDLLEIGVPELSSDTLVISDVPSNTGERDYLDSIMDNSEATLVIWGDIQSSKAVNANCCFLPHKEMVETLRNEGLPSFYLPFTNEEGNSNLIHIIEHANKGADGEYLYHYGTFSPISYEDRLVEANEGEEVNVIAEEEEVSHMKKDKNALIIGGKFSSTIKVEGILDTINKDCLDSIVLVSPNTHLSDITISIEAIPTYKAHVDLEKVLEPCMGIHPGINSLPQEGGVSFNESFAGSKFVAPFLMDIIKAQGLNFDNYVYVDEDCGLSSQEFSEVCDTLDEIRSLNDTANIVVKVFDFDTSPNEHVSLLSPDNHIGAICPGFISWVSSPSAIKFFNRFKLALGWSLLTGDIDDALEMALNSSTKAITCMEIATGGDDGR